MFPVDMYGLQFPGQNQLTASDFNFGGTSNAFSSPNSGMGGAGGFQFGMNAPTFQMGLQGLGALGNLWGAYNANRLAKEQFNFTRDITNTNMNNSMRSYNTALSDRARARGIAEGQSQSQIDDYISRNSLTR